MVNIENFLNALFSKAAKMMEQEHKGKIYCYMVRDLWSGEVKGKGLCIVNCREYNRSIDCDVLTCEDIRTGNVFSCNQFEIELEMFG